MRTRGVRGVAAPVDKRAEVIAGRIAGEPMRAVCRRLGVPERTGRRWWTDHMASIPPISGGADDAENPEDMLRELVLDYARENLTTLVSQARTFRDEGWLKKQDANGVAILHGVLADKSTRVVELYRTLTTASGGEGLASPAETSGLPDRPRG
jgi:transposase-like protein